MVATVASWPYSLGESARVMRGKIRTLITRGKADAAAYAATPRSTLSTPMSLPRCFDVADFVRTTELSVWMAALLGPLLVLVCRKAKSAPPATTFTCSGGPKSAVSDSIRLSADSSSTVISMSKV